MRNPLHRIVRRCREEAFLREERRTGRSSEPRPIAPCAHAIVDWILHAQVVTPDDGVAQLYDIVEARWSPSYPETTGYIISSLLAAADRGVHDPERLREAAIRMGNWLAGIQMEDGAFQSGHIGVPHKRPAVFNTGQVLRGFTALVEHGLDTGGRFEGCARKAAAWMVGQQDEDGAWRRGVTPLAEGPCHTYYVYAAGGLASYGRRFADEAAVRIALANARWVASLVAPDGWIPLMSFEANERPLLHTVAYTIQGLLDIGLQTGHDELVSLAESMARRILLLQNPDTGGVPGKVSRGFVSDAAWSSTTGNAQMACVWFTLHALRRDPALHEAAARANAFNCSIQDLNHRDPDRRGGLRGNYPSIPAYSYARYMNWTAKFHLDALLMEMDPARPASA